MNATLTDILVGDVARFIADSALPLYIGKLRSKLRVSNLNLQSECLSRLQRADHLLEI